jgi:hypothetical protein
MPAVKEDDTPFVCQIVRQPQLSTANLGQAKTGKRSAAIQHFVGRAWHDIPSKGFEVNVDSFRSTIPSD